MSQRYPRLLLLAVLLMAALALWVGHFLATFDLNRYREQVTATLSERLQTPVQLGDVHLELREGGIALRFADVHIGTENTAVELQARKLWLQLAWHGLLLRKPILTEVAFDRPRLRLSSPLPQPGGTPSAPTDTFDLQMLGNLRVNRVEIHEGLLDLNWQDSAGAWQNLSLSALDIELDQFGRGSTVAFSGTGDLAGQAKPARIAILGSVALPDTGSPRDAVWDLTVESKGVDASQLAKLLPTRTGMHATGSFDLALLFKGAPAKEAEIQVNLTGKAFGLVPGPAIQKPVPIKSLQLAGTWQQQENSRHFRQATLQFNDLRLAGELTLVTGIDGHQLTGRLNHSILPLDTVRQWVPPALQATNPLFSRRLPGGQITLNHARFRAEIPTDPQGFSSFALEELEGEAHALSWDLGAERKAELESLAFRLENSRWHLERGSGMIAGLPATLTATVSPQSDGQPQFALDVTLRGPASEFLAFQSKPLPEELNIGGALAIKAHLAGTPDRYDFDLLTDLAQLEISHGNRFQMPPSPGSLVNVRGQGTRSSLTIAQGELALAKLAGQLAGTLDWSDALTVNLSAQFKLADLAEIYAYAPAIDKLQVRGGAALNIVAKGPLTELQPQTTLDLVDVGIPTHGFVADISQLNGRLHLEGKTLRSETMTARLGASPVALKAYIADLGQPRLQLDVKAPSMRADELIFRSDRTSLRDLEGRLIFDRSGLFFTPVKVRLDGGTRATINGSVKNFAAPQVTLDITGDYAKVEEIIGLWTDESPAAAAARQARHAGTAHAPPPPILITVDAREGDLYSMKFARAKARIVPSAGKLLIHPLDFNVGEGYCTTQVLVDYSGESTVLRVSGHVEDVDAYEVYNELLDRKSIMRGQLRGDFFLQGELGEHRFLPTSFGNFNLAVRDGVMRHSPLMGTVFSLLNVSQLFKFQLPDVDLEGVPFTRMTAELAVDKGVLHTENIRIDSEAMNMSYIGNYDMVRDRLDLLVVVKPLGTIDKVVTRLPIAGWILGGDQRALITAQFRVTGSGAKPKVEAIPISAMSKGVLGIFQRTLGLPLKLIEDPAILWGGGGDGKQ